MWSTSCLLTHFPITVSVVSMVILQGQPPPLGRWARPRLAHHLASWQPHGYHAPLKGARGCPSPSVQPPHPQRSVVQVGTSEGHGPRRSKPWAQRGHFWRKEAKF